MEKLVVFFADSITDAGRNRENDHNSSYGCATMVSGALGVDALGVYHFLNRGISGNRVIDLLARVKRDLINLKPDYIIILIGVNDVWHEYTRQNGSSEKQFEAYYGMLIDQIREALTEVSIMILEPFVLPGRATVTDEEHPERWEMFSQEVPPSRSCYKASCREERAALYPPAVHF